MERLSGYRGELRRALEEEGINIGDLISVRSRGFEYRGILMPRSELEDEWHIVLKLKSGYNIGVAYRPGETVIRRLGEAEKPHFRPPPPPVSKEGLPRVSIISTGGTIASRVDYFSGRVYPAISASDLYSVVPELSEIAVIRSEILYSVFSEDLTPEHWSGMARRVAEEIEGDVDGVVITHGTDTMGYSAAALSFALQELPVPVILVGSQRSSDRPSSDAALNLIGAVTAAARAPFAEVVVGMHRTTSDTEIAFHRGTKVRKCHTSARWAFQSVNTEPLALYRKGRIEMILKDYRRRDPERQLVLRDRFEERVALVKFHPGFDPELIDWLVDRGYRGIVLEGTGLGHVAQRCFKSVGRAVEEGLIVAMTSQCIWGRVHMKVYRNGIMLLRLGVIPMEDMLPETALVKLMWALGQTEDREEAVRLLRKNIAHEFSPRTLYQPWGGVQR
ncbi:Glu-tRNA(Gln) amidotransferase GatDE subunit D [Candidatus Bathyarchaeota archaeon]|nr:MAG: Glu-tRNA(Gln) amidotransferase GatDE subunit D [Candidatus Bathyarchaeota archaeon]